MLASIDGWVMLLNGYDLEQSRCQKVQLSKCRDYSIEPCIYLYLRVALFAECLSRLLSGFAKPRLELYADPVAQPFNSDPVAEFCSRTL